MVDPAALRAALSQSITAYAAAFAAAATLLRLLASGGDASDSDEESGQLRGLDVEAARELGAAAMPLAQGAPLAIEALSGMVMQALQQDQAA
jgi:hypothetical protein